MPSTLRVGSRLCAAAFAMVAAACGDDGGSAATTIAAGPVPGEMCADGESPSVAAYDRATGAFRWAACSVRSRYRSVLSATDDAVYVIDMDPTGHQDLVAFDATDGTELADGGPPEDRPELPDLSESGGEVVVDGFRVRGGQDDPTSVLDATTGEVLWTNPGSPAYDDVWAVGDGAVYVVGLDPETHQPSLVAYELDSGQVRWRIQPIDPYGAEIGWPWHVQEDEVFTIWSNLAVLSTESGETVWHTGYPVVAFPRMTGVRANDDSVFVAFSSVPSGGD